MQLYSQIGNRAGEVIDLTGEWLVLGRDPGSPWCSTTSRSTPSTRRSFSSPTGAMPCATSAPRRERSSTGFGSRNRSASAAARSSGSARRCSTSPGGRRASTAAGLEMARDRRRRAGDRRVGSGAGSRLHRRRRCVVGQGDRGAHRNGDCDGHRRDHGSARAHRDRDGDRDRSVRAGDNGDRARDDRGANDSRHHGDRACNDRGDDPDRACDHRGRRRWRLRSGGGAPRPRTGGHSRLVPDAGRSRPVGCGRERDMQRSRRRIPGRLLAVRRLPIDEAYDSLEIGSIAATGGLDQAARQRV